MAKKELTNEMIDEMVRRVLSSRKYADAAIPPETVRDLILQEIPLRKNDKEIEKAMREKLHQIVAPYLGDPDYEAAEHSLDLAAAEGKDALDAWCLEMLRIHSSSRERIPVMEEFYRTIFSVTGKPASIIDLACAMDPFSFPWMGLPAETRYDAYDLHTPRVRLLNSYFRAAGIRGKAEVRDILLDPPRQEADVAFFFKEAHRFESRKKDCCREFFAALNVRHIVVTLPAENLTGQHQMRERQRGLIQKSIEGSSRTITELEVAGEMIFILS